MNYREAREYLEEASERGSVLGLSNIQALLGELSDPQDDLKFIHITGTNGKGSVLSFISSVLAEAGYTAGAYVSPTVRGYLERIQINGQWINEEEFADIIEDCKKAVDTMREKGQPLPTVFEIETAAAFLYFKKKNCDLVVLEAGMGGALDATNVVKNTAVCVFTSISLDHMGFLGNTVRQIAANKAGIMKPGCYAVTAPQTDDAMEELNKRAGILGCPLFEVDTAGILAEDVSYKGQTLCFDKEWYGRRRLTVPGSGDGDDAPHKIRISLAGVHQIENAAVAYTALLALIKQGYSITAEPVLEGFKKARWEGRFTCISENPAVIVDGAHNPAAAIKLKNSLELYFDGRPFTFIMGVFKDKEYNEMAEILGPLAEKIYTVELPDKGRTLPAEQLAEAVRTYCPHTEAVGDISRAVKKALAKAGPVDVIVICGSLSYLGQVMDLFTGDLP